MAGKNPKRAAAGRKGGKAAQTKRTTEQKREIGRKGGESRGREMNE